MGLTRKIKKMITSRNPGSDTVDNLGETGEIHSVSDHDNSVESIYYQETLNQHCGCFAPAGGRCSECGAISCSRCHQHCGGTENPSPLGCGKPLCREHSNYMEVDNGRILPLCKQCFDKASRKQNRQKVFKFLFAPFMNKETDSEQRHTQ